MPTSSRGQRPGEERHGFSTWYSWRVQACLGIMLVLALGAVFVVAVGALRSDRTSSRASGLGEGSVVEARAVACGEHVEARPRGSGTPLEVSGSFPTEVASSPDRVRGTVTLTNLGRSRFRGTTAATPDVFLVRDGIVVTVPVAVRDVGAALDLAPGATQSFEAIASLMSCNLQSATTISLPPGNYEIYTIQNVVPDSSPLQPIALQGGPWVLTVLSP